MNYTTSHAMGVRLQTAKLMNLPWVQMANTTLNERLNIQSGVAPDGGAAPTMAWLAIGNKGTIQNTTADGSTYVQPIQHDPTDTALVNQVPFVLRTLANDLDTATRLKYGLRKEVVINGVTYIAYYLRALDLTSTVIQMFISTTVDGVTTNVPWVPSTDNLNPTLPTTTTTGAVTANGSMVVCQAVVTVALSASDITELLNVASILYSGNTNMAIISELALVAAVNKTISASVSGGGTISYNEAIGAIICSSDSTYYYLPGLNQGTTLTFNVGGGEPLYGLTDGVSSTVKAAAATTSSSTTTPTSTSGG